jgi:hypothetical protein
MIPYLGCETAREMLDEFADGELAVDDQVAVEAHLRWCRTCAARIEDLCLIGSGIRAGAVAVNAAGPLVVHSAGSPVVNAAGSSAMNTAGSQAMNRARDDEQALAVIQSGVLTRIRAEHDQSLRIRTRELFVDRRLLWPALGATAAVLICLCGAFSVLQLAAKEQPDSLAAMIQSLADPGSDRNPMRLDAAASVPRSLEDSIVLDQIGEDEAVFAVATVVTREGRIAGYEVLDSRASRGDVAALLHAVKQSRFEPALAPGGRTVAVNMVWLFAWTTVEQDGQLEELLKGSARNNRVRVEVPVPALTQPPVADPVKPEGEEPTGRRSATLADSTTA